MKSTNKNTVVVNNLMYQNHLFQEKYTWEEAKEYVKKLRLGGYDDWRLPTLSELRELGAFGMFGSQAEGELIKKEFIHNMPTPNSFWTSDEDFGGAYVVVFGSGGSVDSKSKRHYILSVRG